MISVVLMALVALATASSGSNFLCLNSCRTANNGVCEDGGPSTVGTPAENLGMCEYGTDCTDCGTRGMSSCIALLTSVMCLLVLMLSTKKSSVGVFWVCFACSLSSRCSPHVFEPVPALPECPVSFAFKRHLACVDHFSTFFS